MTSIYQQAMGAEFEKLHPMIQKRFGFSTDDGIASIGRGVMEKVWLGRFHTLPFLYVGSWRNIMFPESGENVPFTIENYAYRDSFGRETVTWIRTFDFGDHRRRFDATMIHSQERRKIVDYMGTHQHLAVDIDLGVAPDGGLILQSGSQRVYEGALAVRFPTIFTGTAQVREWFEESTSRFRIEVEVSNRQWGRLFGYRGWFHVAWRPCDPGEIPSHARPVREESRE
jgi:hypothetical protein